MTDPDELRLWGRTWTKYAGSKKGQAVSERDAVVWLIFGMLFALSTFLFGIGVGNGMAKSILVEDGICVWTVDPVSGEKTLAAKCGEVE